MKRSLISVLLALCLALALPALAESDFDFDATVVCVQPEYVAAAIGGTVASVPVLAGDLVSAGDTLAQLSTTKIYAPADGTVTGVFCAPGDSVSEVTDRYSALLYIEPDSRYTLTASTDNSYNLSDNKYIHVG
jgi:multidrug resistance efflux pump